MIIALLLTALLLLAVSSLLGLVLTDLVRIRKDLEYINLHDTNATVTFSSGLSVVGNCVDAINENLARNWKLNEQQFQRELQIRQMLTDLTHDIKTPLTVARGYVQLLSKNVDDSMLRSCQRAAASLDSVDYYLRYLMDFNLAQEKSRSLTLSQVDLSHLVQQDLFTAFDQLSARNLDVALQIDGDVTLTSDETLLHRIVQNLVGNWFKYAKRAARVQLHQAENGLVTLVFANETDQPHADARMLVQRFNSSTKDQLSKESSGLGLDIVRNLVSVLGGHMSLDVNPGYFNITIILHDFNRQQAMVK